MKKKKSLWSSISILIVAVLAIIAFVRGNTQLWLLVAAFTIWLVWAVMHFLVPYIKEQLHRYEAKRIRRKCEKQDAENSQITVPDVSDSVTRVLLRHVNYRITAYLQSVYPEATWEWREEFPEQIVVKGGTGRIKLFGVNGFNFADVTFDQNAGIDCSLINVVPITTKLCTDTTAAEPVEAALQPETGINQQNPIDPQVWYEVQGRKVLETLVADLHSRGYNNLTIKENGDIAIKQADGEKVRPAFESIPEKTYWTRLCKVFEREGIAAQITDGGILLSW